MKRIKISLSLFKAVRNCSESVYKSFVCFSIFCRWFVFFVKVHRPQIPTNEVSLHCSKNTSFSWSLVNRRDFKCKHSVWIRSTPPPLKKAPMSGFSILSSKLKPAWSKIIIFTCLLYQGSIIPQLQNWVTHYEVTNRITNCFLNFSSQ